MLQTLLWSRMTCSSTVLKYPSAVLTQTPVAYTLVYCNAFSTTFTAVRCFQLRKRYWDWTLPRIRAQIGAQESETLPLVVLTLISAINFPKAILFSFGVEMSTDASDRTNLEMLKWIEVDALVFIPALLSLMVTFALLSHLLRFGMFLFKYNRRSYQYHPWNWMTEAQSPLIGNEES